MTQVLPKTLQKHFNVCNDFIY